MDEQHFIPHGRAFRIVPGPGAVTVIDEHKLERPIAVEKGDLLIVGNHEIVHYRHGRLRRLLRWRLGQSPKKVRDRVPVGPPQAMPSPYSFYPSGRVQLYGGDRDD